MSPLRAQSTTGMFQQHARVLQSVTLVVRAQGSTDSNGLFETLPYKVPSSSYEDAPPPPPAVIAPIHALPAPTARRSRATSAAFAAL